MTKHFTPEPWPPAGEVPQLRQAQSNSGCLAEGVVQPFKLLDWGSVCQLFSAKDVAKPNGAIVLWYNGSNHFEAVMPTAK